MIVRPAGWSKAMRGQKEIEVETGKVCTYVINGRTPCNEPRQWNVWPVEQSGKMPELGACDLHLPAVCREAAVIEDAGASRKTKGGKS